MNLQKVFLPFILLAFPLGAMELDTIVPLTTPSEISTKLFAQALTEENPKTDYLTLFKQITQLRRINTTLLSQLFRLPYEVRELFSLCELQHGECQALIIPLIVKGTVRPLEKQFLVLASLPSLSHEALSLFKKSLEVKQWEIAKFSVTKLPLSSLLLAKRMLEKITLTSENAAPLKTLAQTIVTRNPSFLTLHINLELHPENTENAEFVVQKIDQLYATYADAKMVARHFLGGFLFTQEDQLFLEKTLSSSKKKLQTLQTPEPQQHYSLTIRCLAFLIAVEKDCKTLVSLMLMTRLPEDILRRGQAASIRRSHKKVFVLIHDYLVRRDRSERQNLGTLFFALRVKNKLMIRCILELNEYLVSQKESRKFLYAVLDDSEKHVQSLVNDADMSVKLAAVRYLIATNNESLLSVLLNEKELRDRADNFVRVAFMYGHDDLAQFIKDRYLTNPQPQS